MNREDTDRMSGLLITAFVLLGILALFLLVMLTGRPIRELGSYYWSVVYSLVVYVPPLLLALVGIRRTRRLSSKNR